MACLRPSYAGLDCWIGKGIDSPRRMSTGCAPRFSGQAMLTLEGAPIGEALTLRSEGAPDHDCMTKDRTNLKNRSIGSQLAHSGQCIHWTLHWIL